MCVRIYIFFFFRYFHIKPQKFTEISRVCLVSWLAEKKIAWTERRAVWRHSFSELLEDTKLISKTYSLNFSILIGLWDFKLHKPFNTSIHLPKNQIPWLINLTLMFWKEGRNEDGKGLVKSEQLSDVAVLGKHFRWVISWYPSSVIGKFPAAG